MKSRFGYVVISQCLWGLRHLGKRSSFDPVIHGMESVAINQMAAQVGRGMSKSFVQLLNCTETQIREESQ